MRRTNPGGGGPKGSGSVLGCRQTGGSNLDILDGAGLAQLGEQELGEQELGMPLPAVQAGRQ